MTKKDYEKLAEVFSKQNFDNEIVAHPNPTIAGQVYYVLLKRMIKILKEDNPKEKLVSYWYRVGLDQASKPTAY